MTKRRRMFMHASLFLCPYRGFRRFGFPSLWGNVIIMINELRGSKEAGGTVFRSERMRQVQKYGLGGWS